MKNISQIACDLIIPEAHVFCDDSCFMTWFSQEKGNTLTNEQIDDI